MPLADPCPKCGKVCYATRAEAERKVRKARRRKDPEYKDQPLNSYRCGNVWHFGHLDAIKRDRRKK